MKRFVGIYSRGWARLVLLISVVFHRRCGRQRLAFLGDIGSTPLL